jgi:protein gp37
MSDLFHDDVPEEFIRRVFDVIVRAPQHEFQILTKRSARLADLCSRIELPPNAWLGVSVENEKYTPRIDDLRKVDAAVRFLSIEPLLGPIRELDLDAIHWVIVGGESGPKARPMAPEWVRSIRDQCRKARVPFFFKQWCGVQKSRTGRVLDRRTWDEMPVIPQRMARPSATVRSLAVVHL